mgnify:FL=1
MIALTLNEADFEYDMRSLLQAFFPGVTLRVGKNLAVEDFEEVPEILFRVIYGDCTITITLSEKGPDFTDIRAEKSISVPYIGKNYSAERKETKDRLKRGFYQMLSDYTGKTLLWGTLSGIRPAKLPRKMIEEGMEEADIVRSLQQTYLLSDEKTQRLMQVAAAEHRILSSIREEKGYSLYLGIPFCPSRCLYCSFTAYPIAQWKDHVDEYLQAVAKELVFCREAFSDRILQSIYIGGGTPSVLTPAQTDWILTKIKETLDTSQVLEWTIEGGRPDSLSPELFSVWKAHGISRISINPQTMNQETLDLIGRKHTVEETVQRFHEAREAGLDNINMDLILGLPGETTDMVEHTLEEIAALAPDSLTVHSLALKRAARLNENFSAYKALGMENSEALMTLCDAYATRMGLAPYYLYRQKNMAGNLENIGYAKAGKECVYNILIMEEVEDIVAIGAGAASKRILREKTQTGERTSVARCENVKDVQQYMARIEEMIARKRELYLDA